MVKEKHQKTRCKVTPGVDFEWSDKSWTHNVFRFLELVFGRKSGIRFEGATYLNNDGSIVHVFGTFENILAVSESIVRDFLAGLVPKFRFVPVPQFASIGGMPTPFSPFMFAIAFDATTGLDGAGSHFTTFTYSATCTGSNRTLTIGITTNEVGAPTVSSASYNAVAATQATSVISGNSGLFLWYLAAPATGSNTVSMTLSKSGLVSSAVMSFTGTAASPLGAVGNNNGSGSSAASVAVTTTVANSWVVDSLFVDAGKSTVNPVTSGTNQTSRYVQDAFGVNNQLIAGSSETTTTTGSHTMSWTLTGTHVWLEVAMEIKPLTVVTSGDFLSFM